MPGGNDAIEAWLGTREIIAGEQDGIRFRHDGSWLFGMLDIDEADNENGPPLQTAAEKAYGKIFKLLDELKYPFSLRFWNYIRDINGITHGLERYRQFNLGRQEAFLSSGRQVTGELPAACALGTGEGPLRIAFLAGRTSGIAIENPRQISAFDYPQDYGPRSPTFSRALLLPIEGLLLISGTASIVGHKTMHIGDVRAQTRETLLNLQSVVDEANKQAPGFNVRNLSCRVYVRYDADVEAVAEEIRKTWGQDCSAVFVQADICRSDLLLEIEAIASNRAQPCA